jgi:hypothetical protein
MNAPVRLQAHTSGPETSRASSWEGRSFGAIVLAAFLLYGVGSATADQPIGLALVVANSIAVSLAGLIGFRLLRPSDHSIGVAYLATRLVEAVLLGGGILLAESAGVSDADTIGYLLAMIALGVGSIPFLATTRLRQMLPQPLTTWGVYGYAALAVGALLELATGRSLAVIFAVPGGLFELALGLYLVRHGFGQATPTQQVASAGTRQDPTS